MITDNRKIAKILKNYLINIVPHLGFKVLDALNYHSPLSYFVMKIYFYNITAPYFVMTLLQQNCTMLCYKTFTT